MKLSIPAGTTSKRIAIFIQDSASTTGAGKSGLVFNTSGLICYSWIDTDGNAAGTVQALQTATRGTWTTRGFVEKDATNMPGFYEFGIPDALLAAGVKWAVVMFSGAAGMAPLPLEIEVTAVSNQDAVRGGMTALPNAAAEAAGGLYTRGSGAGQINQAANGQVDTNVARWLNTAVSTPTVAGVPNVNAKTWNDFATVALPLIPTVAGRTLDCSAGGEAGVDWANVGSPTTTVGLTGTTIATSQVVASVSGAVGSVTGLTASNLDATISSRTKPADTQAAVTTVTNLTNAPTAGDLTATMKASVTTAATAATPTAAAVTGNVGGNVTGSVGSVVGAVGSVAGSVGGNVAGSVGSVVGAVGSVTAAVAITSNVKKNQALTKFQFLMTDSTTNAPKTGLTVSVTRSIDGAAYIAGTLANVAEVGSGTYTVDFGAGDVNGNVIVLQATAVGANTTFERLVTQP